MVGALREEEEEAADDDDEERETVYPIQFHFTIVVLMKSMIPHLQYYKMK